MTKAAKQQAKAAMAMECPFCGETAAVKLCRGERITYYWRCACEARGFIPEPHFRQLDKLKKISFTS